MICTHALQSVIWIAETKFRQMFFLVLQLAADSYTLLFFFQTTPDDHTLVLIVRDLGVPPQRNSANITFLVTDINEFPPVFSESEYAMTVLSTTPENTPLLQVLATDEDRGDNTITYSITNLEGEDVEFSVRPDGVIVSNQRFPNVVNEVYNYTVLI